MAIPPLVIQSEAWNLAAPPRTRGTPQQASVYNAGGLFARETLTPEQKIPRCKRQTTELFQTNSDLPLSALNDSGGGITFFVDTVFPRR